MFALMLADAVAAHSADSGSIARALELCRPRIERRVAGEINAIDVDAAQSRRGWTVIRGPVTAFIGMGPPVPGSASTHHLIRAQFNYVCWTRGARVAKLIVTPLR